MTAEALRRGEEKDLHLPIICWLSLPKPNLILIDD
jgi:hypothetical protein